MVRIFNVSAHRRALSRVPRATALLLVALALAVTELAVVGPTTGQVASAQAASAVQAAAPATKAPRKTTKRWRPTPGVKFNVPRVGGERQFRLERQVIDAINHARPRSVIRMSMFSYDRTQVSDALLNARRKRKVKIQVIVNGHEYPKAQKMLRKALKSHRGRPSFFYQCKASCRGQGDVNHSKFITFSQTGGAKNVVMLGSLNMKLNGSENQFNDLLTINDNKDLYNEFTKVFREMKYDRLAHPSYLVKNFGPRDKYQLRVLPFPRKKAATKKTKWTPSRDPITRLLAPIKCTGAKTNSGRTIVRVNMHAWDGDRGVMIAKKFRDLYAKGCDVKLLVGYAGGLVRQVFGSPTKRGFVPIQSTGFDTDDDDEIDLYSHEKILIVNGNYGGKQRKMIVTGSSNYQNGGQYGDEIIFRVFDRGLYRKYADNWGWAWKYHSHGFILRMRPASRRASVSGLGLSPMGLQPTLTDGLGTDSPEWRDE